MDLKKLALAAVAGTSLLAAAPAFAEPQDWARGRDHGRDYGRDHGRDHGRDYGRDHGRYERHFRHDHYRAPARHGYNPPQRVVERVVVVQQAAPVYYDNPPARPVLSAQVPIGRNANINFDLKL